MKVDEESSPQEKALVEKLKQALLEKKFSEAYKLLRKIGKSDPELLKTEVEVPVDELDLYSQKGEKLSGTIPVNLLAFYVIQLSKIDNEHLQRNQLSLVLDEYRVRFQQEGLQALINSPISFHLYRDRDIYLVHLVMNFKGTFFIDELHENGADFYLNSSHRINFKWINGQTRPDESWARDPFVYAIWQGRFQTALYLYKKLRKEHEASLSRKLRKKWMKAHNRCDVDILGQSKKNNLLHLLIYQYPTLDKDKLMASTFQEQTEACIQLVSFISKAHPGLALEENARGEIPLEFIEEPQLAEALLQHKNFQGIFFGENSIEIFNMLRCLYNTRNENLEKSTDRKYAWNYPLQPVANQWLFKQLHYWLASEKKSELTFSRNDDLKDMTKATLLFKLCEQFYFGFDEPLKLLIDNLFRRIRKSMLPVPKPSVAITQNPEMSVKVPSKDFLYPVPYEEIHQRLLHWHNEEKKSAPDAKTNIIVASLTIVYQLPKQPMQHFTILLSNGKKSFVAKKKIKKNLEKEEQKKAENKDLGFSFDYQSLLFASGDKKKAKKWYSSICMGFERYFDEYNQEMRGGRLHGDSIHSEAALCRYLEKKTTIENLCTLIQEKIGKAAIITLVLDACSSQSLCDNYCPSLLVGLQQSHRYPHGFLTKFYKALKVAEFGLPEDKLSLNIRYSFVEKHSSYERALDENAKHKRLYEKDSTESSVFVLDSGAPLIMMSPIEEKEDIKSLLDLSGNWLEGERGPTFFLSGGRKRKFKSEDSEESSSSSPADDSTPKEESASQSSETEEVKEPPLKRVRISSANS